MEVPEDLRSFQTFTWIIAALRGPDGCPWDRKQTHGSLRTNMLEECYEALAALDEENNTKLCEELGDIMLQIGLHSQIAADAGEFDIGDVIEGINKKLIYRHPHVFGEVKVANAEEVSHNWEALKKRERGEDASMLASVPEQLPALTYSQSIQRRVAQAGFDWENIEGVIEKLAEEVAEFRESSEEEKAGEFGDILFTLVNVARSMGIDSEAALRDANRKFYRRFSHMEELCRQRGLSFADLSFDQQNALWEAAKKATGHEGSSGE